MSISAFNFDPDTHIYRLEPSGMIIPGHTRVLDLGGLVPYKDIEPDILERKSAIGREAHLACLYHDQEKQFTFDPRVEGHLNAWRAFRRESGFVPILCECRGLYSFDGLFFGMQIDRFGRFPGDKYETLVELKTVTQVMPHHGVQLAAQAGGVASRFNTQLGRDLGLETPLARFLSRKRVVVQLRENGRYGLFPFKDSGDLEQFRRSLGTTYWKMQHEKFYREVQREQLNAAD